MEYNGASVASRIYLHSDHQGSIIALSDSTGAVTGKFAYDGFGIPANNNSDTFGYTGQVYFKDLGLDYYKARFYSPKLGRFLQTDPIGYKDDMDLYSYVGNDPLDKTDPSGTEEFPMGSVMWRQTELAESAECGGNKRCGEQKWLHEQVEGSKYLLESMPVPASLGAKVSVESALAIRFAYKEAISKIPQEAMAMGGKLVEKAKWAFEQRVAVREAFRAKTPSWANFLFGESEETFEGKMERYMLGGATREQAYNRIIQGSAKSRDIVDKITKFADKIF